MESLIIGASGLVGSYLYKTAPKGYEVIGTYNKHPQEHLTPLDITNPNAVKKLIGKVYPDIIFIPAAFTNVDKCEEDIELCYEVNVDGIKNIIKLLDNKVLVVYFSTDYIFDGYARPYEETSRSNPINEYGKSKLIAERWITKFVDNYLIIRTTGVYGWEAQGKNAVMGLLQKAELRLNSLIPQDQVTTPTYAGSLAKVVWELVKRGKTGVYNVAGSSLISRYDFALLVEKVFNINANIRGVDTESLHLPAKRPLSAGLVIDKIRSLGLDMPSAEEGLRLMKDEKMSSIR